MSDLFIKSRTSGFCSPAESYVDKRLDLNELVAPNSYSTFYFQYDGPAMIGIRPGNIIVIDKSIHAKLNELVVVVDDKNEFKIQPYDGKMEYWGRISWVLKKQ